MKSLYFIRHGESLANAGSTPLPNADIPLTEKGHIQARPPCPLATAGHTPKPHLSFCHASHTTDRPALLSVL